MPLSAPEDEILTPEQDEIIRRIYNTCQDLDGFQLSNLTHQRDTPWDRGYNQEKGDWAEIPDALIQGYYGQKVQAGAGRTS